MLRVHQFACLDDNFGFLVKDDASGVVACIDTPDADRILLEASALGWTIDFILTTHWHRDHAGGNEAVKAATGCTIIAPHEVSSKSNVDRVVAEGDVVNVGHTSFDVIDVGGHTLGHIAYYGAADAVLFSGDALFPMGCGRLFEGTFIQLAGSLYKLRSLPSPTQIFASHEYGKKNADFAQSIDPSAVVAHRANQIHNTRADGRWTVPSTIAEECATNPFFRIDALRQHGESDVDALTRIRTARDIFR